MNRRKPLPLLLTAVLIIFTACAPTTSATTSPQTQPPAQNTDVAPQSTEIISANSNSAPVETTIFPTEEMDPSLACSGGKTTADVTVELTEGPYYTPNTPERTNLMEAGMAGTKLVITGYVFDTNCQPVANAWLDFWQADANGVYDNNGYTLRGHQFTDANGRYELTTVVPGIYPGRTEHIHLKVQAPGGKIITSQLFFPGVTLNDSDGIFDESLLLVITETSAGLIAQYNFVVP